jgi:acetyl-CoA acetyltransferase
MSNRDDIVIVSGVRTPFSKFSGAFKEIYSTDLSVIVIVIRESLKRAGHILMTMIYEFKHGVCGIFKYDDKSG